jgi:hypothetical protein
MVNTTFSLYRHRGIRLCIQIGVLINPWPDLLAEVFFLMVRIFHLMLVLLYI